MLSTMNTTNEFCCRHCDSNSEKIFLRVGFALSEYLSELGFNLKNYDYEYSEDFISSLKEFLIHTNKKYNIIKDNFIEENFTYISVCEEWLFSFLKKAVECKRNSR